MYLNRIKRKNILLFIIFFFSIFLCDKVFALDINATEISLIDKSSTAEVESPVLNNNKITSKVTFNEENDYAIYDLTITNNEKNKYKIESIVDNNKNRYITTSYDYSKDYFSNNTKVKIKFLYKNKLINQDKIEIDNLVITIKLVNDKGESTNIIINNPKTGDNIILYVIVLIFGVLGFIYVKKRIQFKKINIGLFILIIPLLLLPFAIFALDRYELPVTFKSIEAKGEFEIHDVMVEGIGLRQVIHGNKIGDLPVQDKEGYSFNGYEDDRNVAVSEDTIVLRSMTVKPMYTIINYNITYDYDGGIAFNPDTYNIEDTIILNNPTKPGYTFSGWTGSNGNVLQTEVTINNMTGDLHYIANYSKNSDTAYRVIHRYPKLDGTYDEEVEDLRGVTDSTVRPQTRDRVGFTSPEQQDLLIRADGSSELIYNYTRINCNLLLIEPENIESIFTSGSYPYQTVITIKAKDKPGYTFSKWTDNETAKEYTFELVRDTEIGAVYTPNPNTAYQVVHKKMNLDGETYSVAETEYLTGETDSEVTPEVKTYTGFTSPSPQTVRIKPDGSLIVEYLYTRNKYTLTVEDPEKVEEDKTGEYYYGTEITTVAKDIPGYVFTGWKNGGNARIYTFIITADKTIKPLYTLGDSTAYQVVHKKMNLDGETYTVEETEFLTGVTGSEVTPNTKNYPGFTSPEKQTKTIIEDGSLVIEYKYSRNKYNLIYVDEDNIDIPNSAEAGEYYYGTEVTSVAKDKEGYSFTKWNTEDTTKTITKIIEHDLVLNPVYVPNRYNIVFNNNTGTGTMDNEEMTYNVEKALNKNTFTKPGYVFTGWNTKTDGTGTHYEDEALVKNLVSSGEITLYAEWLYTASPVIVRNDYNTFTVSAPSGNKFIISKTQVSKPTSSTEGWSTETTKDTGTDSKETWYVWVQDENGRISDSHAEITNYKILLNIGEGTQLLVKADNEITGENITSGSYVLEGTPVYPNGELETGYHTLVIKKGTTPITNGSSQIINEDTTFTSSAVSASAPSITVIDHDTFSYGSDGGVAYYVSTSNTKPSAGDSAISTFALDTWITETNTGDLELLEGQTYYVWSESSTAGGAVSSKSASIKVNKVTRSEGVGTLLTTKYDSSVGEEFRDNIVYVLNGSKINVVAELNIGYETLLFKKNTLDIDSGLNHSIEEDTSFTTSATEKTATLTYSANRHGSTLRSVTMRYTKSTVAADGISADGYTFLGWNTSEDGTGTTYETGDVIKEINVVPYPMTLYANWLYSAIPTITVTDYNRFQVSAIEAKKYLISSTQNTKPTTSTSGWSTSSSSGDLTLSIGQIYYVWVQDEDGNISDNYATISVKTITKDEGEGTTIIVKNGQESGSTINFSENKANVLAGSTIYAGAELKQGYDNLIFKKNTIDVSSGLNHIIDEDTIFTSSATEKTATLTYDANGHGIAPNSVVMKYKEATLVAGSINTDGYTFAGWNTKADASGTTYNAGEVFKEANKVPSDTTLYAIWIYTAIPVVSVNDHNTFTVSAPFGDKYIISKAQTSRPTSSTEGWSTTTTKNTSTDSKEIYYVWVQDIDEKISENYAIIENYKITITAGEGTLLTVKADNDVSGSNITNGNYVLDGTTVYPKGELETGYHSLIIKKNTVTIDNESNHVIYGDTSFTSSATSMAAPTITVIDHNTFNYESENGAAYYISTSSSKPSAGDSASNTFALDTWTTATSTGNLTLSEGQTYYVWSESSITGGTVSSNSASIGVNKVTRSEGEGTSLVTKYDSSSGEDFATDKAYVLYGSSVYVTSELKEGYDNLVIKKNSANISNGLTHTINGNITFTTSATEKTATLTYNSNGHGIAPSSVIMKYKESTSAASSLSADNYRFDGWNTKQDGSGTTYNAGDVVKTSNTIPSDMTLYAIWVYNATPVITRNDYNTFTVNAPSCDKYLISNSQSTKPTSSTEGWSTTTTKDTNISTKETWYVWVQDVDGKISDNSASITNYKVTLTAGSGTTLIVKADNEAIGQNILSESYVLEGTPVYPIGNIETGYDNLVLKRGITPITNGSIQLINEDTLFETNASSNSLIFNNQTLNSGIYGIDYTSNQFNAATNGTGSYSYSLVSGYPEGASLNDRIISFEENTPSGTYEIEVLATDNNSGVTAVATITIVINKRPIVITANEQTIIYGNSISTGASSYSITGELAASDTISSITLTPSTTNITDSGSITPSSVVITDSSENNKTNNYDIVYEIGQLNIRNASISFNSTGGSPSTGYFQTKKGETGITNKGYYSTTYDTIGPLPERQGYALKGWYTSAEGGEKVKNADFSFTGTAVDGYVSSNAWDVTEDKVIYAQWDINPLTFEGANLGSVTYGTEFTSNPFPAAYNGTGSYTYTLQSGYPANATLDSANRTIYMPEDTPAGTYNIVVRVTDNGSGVIKDATMTIVVNPKSLSVTWGNSSWTYDGTAHSTTATTDTGITSESITLAINGTNSITNVGNSALTVSCQSATSACSNYTLSNTTKTITVTPKAMTVTAAAKSRQYSDANPTLTYSYSGQLSGQTPGFTGALTTSATTTTAIGQYDITKGSLALANNGAFLASNYTMNYVGAKLTINRKTTATTGACLNPTYSGSAQNIAGGGANVTYTNNSQTNVGASNYTVTVTPNANYAWSDGTYGAKTLSCNLQKKQLPAPTLTKEFSTSDANLTSYIHAQSGSYANGIKYKIDSGSWQNEYFDEDTYDGFVDVTYLLQTDYKGAHTVSVKVTNTKNINYTSESSESSINIIVVQLIVTAQTGANTVGGSGFRFVGTKATINAACKSSTTFSAWKIKSGSSWTTWNECNNGTKKSCTFTVENKAYNIGAFCD